MNLSLNLSLVSINIASSESEPIEDFIPAAGPGGIPAAGDGDIPQAGGN